MAGGDRERARIVDFWRAVELFEPQKVDRVDLRSGTPVAEVEPGLPLPWEPGSTLGNKRPPRNTVWRHTVYLGVFSTVETDAVLDRVFGADPRQVETRTDAKAALGAFDVDEQGQALIGTHAVSTCGWAIGRTLSPGPRAKDWLEGFDRAEERFGTLYEWLVAEPGPGPTQALLSLVDGGLVSAPLVKVWEAVRASLSMTADMAGTLSVGGIDIEVSGSAEASMATGSEESQEDGAGGRRSRVLGHPELDALQRVLASLLGVRGRLTLGMRIKSYPVSQTRAQEESERQEILLAGRQGDTDAPLNDENVEPAETPLLNSFIADDLASVAEAVRKGEYGAALRAYLSSSREVAAIPRTDVREEGAAAMRRVSPGHTPPGRWPAKDTHPLALSQQIAVNTITRTLGDRPGLFAVNGPPGTGKTTLLRDLVAHVVVERARVLAGFDKPWDAFTGWGAWETSRGRTAFPRLRPELAGFEIVVASANNGAVDNVTTEIPGRQAVDERWKHADYFAATATNVLDDGKGDKKAWGTLAAQLGNARNRRTFVKRFWWGNRPDGSRGEHGMYALLRNLDQEGRGDQGAAVRQWREAVGEFTRALRERDRLVEARAAVARDLERLPGLGREVDRATRAVNLRERELASARGDHEDAALAHREILERRLSVEAERSRHWEFKPGFWDVVFSLGRRLREWQKKDDDFVSVIGELSEIEHEKGLEEAEARQRTSRCELALDSADSALAKARRGLSAAEQNVDTAWRAWPDHVPLGDVLTDERARELSAPWSDPELTRARTEVFLAALAVHEAFVRAVPGKLSKNLRAAMQVLSGEARNAPDDLVRDALRGLFLVVPVVSSTFASYPRLFGAFDSESLGWLLVDEAGQAAPQQVVGALWRARRAVIVGDPLQLEPVTSLSLPAQQHLRNRFGVEERWLPARTSVQALADSVTPLGTLLDRDEGEPLWVGSPLRVHRRCDDPMFTVSNLVAYDGMMVYGTPSRQDLELPPSQWVHVPASGAGSADHWRPAEGRALKWLLEGLALRGHPMSDVFVLAPFRAVANRVRGIATGFGVPNDRTGTIHTSQGKEAGVVVFVLGGSPDREGAMEWASRTPNLLNVAASRAKRRLYVIGDHTAWAHRHHFATLGRHLPLRERVGG
ncbi:MULTISPECIES: DEAD/DEAH box helicase [unclassified Nocardiopsis]|uniref:DEAD/DEAH box helicase n=1 Tax=Nocardiopsis TaxID=2013 RepID=UPI00387B8E60